MFFLISFFYANFIFLTEIFFFHKKIAKNFFKYFCNYFTKKTLTSSSSCFFKSTLNVRLNLFIFY